MTKIGNVVQKKQYGTLSMVAIIVGIVIGSGIFIKNESLMEGTGSVILTTFAWIIGGLIVLSMMLSFIEISSITKIKGEQGTFKNFSKHLFNEKTSRYIGAYFSFIYLPLVLGAEIIFAIQKFMEIGGMNQMIGDFELWWVITVISFIGIIIIFLINSFFVKPGKAFTMFGSIVKLFPLFIVILAGLIALLGFVWPANNIFDPNDGINSGLIENGTGTNISHLLMILPGVLFAFDGFLYANSMSNETKTPSTFKRAVIISVVFITLTYILFSVMSMTLAPGDMDANGNVEYQFGISSILSAMFPSMEWVGDLLMMAIFISIISATFGYAVTSMWSLADYSDTNNLIDKNGRLLRRNKSGNPSGAGIRMLFFSIIAILLMRGFDLITLYSYVRWGEGLGVGANEAISSTLMTDFTSDIFTVFNFAFYSIIMIGGLNNRFTKKNEIEKIKGFSLFTSFASIIMIGVVGFMIFDIVSSIFNSWFGASDTNGIILSISKLILFITFVATFIISSVILDIKINKTSDDVWATKRIYRKAYEFHIPYSEYSKLISNDVKKDYKLAYLKIEELSGEKIEKPDSIKDSVILNSKDIKNNSNIKGQRCGVCNKIFKRANVDENNRRHCPRCGKLVKKKP
ncbi:MAG: amino acid permease [Mycoplasmataceae bacterium]|nr:amino acid permease [Mycoplasmataceae bacterium]